MTGLYRKILSATAHTPALLVAAALVASGAAPVRAEGPGTGGLLRPPALASVITIHPSAWNGHSQKLAPTIGQWHYALSCVVG